MLKVFVKKQTTPNLKRFTIQIFVLGWPVVLRDVDWIEVGVKPAQVKTWWRRHLKQDEARRAQEAAEKERQRIKTQALSKLTEEEKKALGIHHD